MATHADDKEVDHLDKVDGELGLCKESVNRVLARVVLVSVSGVHSDCKAKAASCLRYVVPWIPMLDCLHSQNSQSVPSWSATAAALVSG